MQAVRPSFLDYFEQKEKENWQNNYGRQVSERCSSDWRVPLDGDFEFVSKILLACSSIIISSVSTDMERNSHFKGKLEKQPENTLKYLKM